MELIIFAIIANVLSGERETGAKLLSRRQRRERSGGRTVGRRLIQLGLYELKGQTRSTRAPPRNQWELLADLLYDYPAIPKIVTNSILDKRFERAFGRFNNDENQHETYTEAREDGGNGYVDPNQGVTHAWLLDHEFGLRGFTGDVHHGHCTKCGKGLPAWRRCWHCIQMMLLKEGEDILITCLRCTNMEHQMALDFDDLCDWHNERAGLRLEECPIK